MLILQMAVMIAVGWTGIYYNWTPNGVALGVVSVGAAWLTTRILLDLLALNRWQFRAQMLATAVLIAVYYPYSRDPATLVILPIIAVWLLTRLLRRDLHHLECSPTQRRSNF